MRRKGRQTAVEGVCSPMRSTAREEPSAKRSGKDSLKNKTCEVTGPVEVAAEAKELSKTTTSLGSAPMQDECTRKDMDELYVLAPVSHELSLAVF